jgi:branched-chain amino acid transport system permease protein
VLFLQLLLNGLQVGAIYALTAAGFALIFGATKIFHVAHGTAFTIAGYAFLFAWRAGWPGWAGVAVAVLAAMAFGVAMERLVYRPIQRHEGSFFTVFVAAFGVSIVVQNLVGMVAGRGFATVDTPLSFSTEIMTDVFVAPMLWIALATAVVLFVALTLFLTRHPAGVGLRALAQNPDLIRTYGLSSNGLSVLAFAIGSALAAPAAIITVMTTGMNEAIGHQVMLISIAATIVGGIGSLRGAAVAGLMLGVVESLALQFVDTQWAEAVSFFVLFAFIIFRPSGIFGVVQTR